MSQASQIDSHPIYRRANGKLFGHERRKRDPGKCFRRFECLC